MKKYTEIIQGTQEWQTLRRAKITGSTVGKITVSIPGYVRAAEMLKAGVPEAEIPESKAVITRAKNELEKQGDSLFDIKRNLPSYQLLAESLGLEDESDEEDDLGSSRERGHAEEPNARAAYEEATGNKVTEVGFITRDDEERIAYSPDGVVEDFGKFVGGIEIKCLAAARHLMAVIENEIPKEYMPQVIQSFVVNDEQEWLDFIFYDPRLPMCPLHVIRVERKDIEREIAESLAYQKKELTWVDEMVKKLNA